MPYLLQISDPDEMRVTLQISGKYSPDVLDDAKRRLLDMYRGALATRYPTTHGDVPAPAEVDPCQLPIFDLPAEEEE